MARGRPQPKKSSSNQKKPSAPPTAEQIDYGKLMGQASEAGKAQFRDALAASIEAYPQQEALQLGTIGNVAANLRGEGGTIYATRWIPGTTTGKGKNKQTTEGRFERVAIGQADPNLYTRRATDQLTAAGAIPAQLGTLADRTAALSEQAAADLQGTDIERELQRQALADLQLGRALSPEEERAATQQARVGMSARGLGTGTGALAAEVLNRDSYAAAREAARRNFAGSTNQLLTGNRQARLGLTSDLIGQTGNIRMNQAGLGQNLAASNIAADPYMRAFAPGTSIGGGTLSTGANMVGNIYNNATQMAGNVASFNANMLDSRYNTWANNRTALEAARITGGATNNAGWMSMLGGVAQGAGSLGGGYLAGQSDRRTKTDIKKVGKDPLGINTYSYRYKGDDRKRTGVMAQEVRKALPEAVEEVEINGKKRLAIRPTVLGQAYADAIASEQKIMFPDGYVVGSGKA